jgi:hypothetical protein
LNLGYDVSPRPKDANFICCRQPGRSLALRRLRQNVWLFGGKSPWPLVEIATSTTWCCSSCFYHISTSVFHAWHQNPTYKGDGVQLGHLNVEAQAQGKTPQFLRDILGVARLGAVDNKGPARLLCRHGAAGGEGQARCVGAARLDGRARLARMSVCRFPSAESGEESGALADTSTASGSS